jgi:hypothetical protein
VALGFTGFAKPAEVRSPLAGFISFLKAECAGCNIEFFRDRRPHFASRAVVLPLLSGGALIGYTLIA